MPKHQKRSWIRGLFKGLFYLLLLCVILVIVAYIYAGEIVKKAISMAVPPVTQTTASVDGVDLSLLSGKIGVRGLTIGNPKGFSDNNIFELGDIAVTFDPKSVFTDKIVIHSVAITGTGISAEMNAKGQTNVGVLNQNIQNYLGSSNGGSQPATTTAKSKEAQGAGKKVVIHDLKINDSKLTLGVAGQTMTLVLPNIHQTNIGEGKKSKTIPEMVATILSYFSSESVKAVLNSGNELMKQSLQNARGMLNSGKDAIKQQADQAKGALDNLKNLF